MPEFGPQDLSVVIPTRRRWHILERTVDALHRQTASGFEIVVVVDGTDDTPPKLEGVRVVTKEHGGPGAARNAGVGATDRRLVMFLGDDMIPVADFVARHVERHQRHPELEVAVLGRAEWHPDVGHSRVHRWMDWSSTQFDYRGITSDDAGWGRFYSSNVSLKRELFEKAGGFDQEFVYYYEDLDLAWRLHQNGLRLLYEPRALTSHLHALRWNDVVKRFQGIAAGEYLMTKKHDWFSPYFADRARRAERGRKVSRIWPLVVDVVPTRLRRVRDVAERRADRWYYQRLAPQFLNAWESAHDLEELRGYLGPQFDRNRLIDHVGEVEREVEHLGEAEFYRASSAYLYDLTAFAMSGTKVPYHQTLRRLVRPGGRLLDWGAGIGSDGLRLLAGGYEVAFADFDNPSTRYLRWRLERRGSPSQVYDIEHDAIPGGFDAAYAFDVIEHVDDPFATLDELERRASLVLVNFLESEPDERHPHHRLPIDSLLEHAARRGILRYRKYYGRSHLVAYRGAGSTSLVDRVRSHVQRRAGGLIPAR